jgi:hypothetical protein
MRKGSLENDAGIRRTPNFVKALAEAKLMVLAAVAASRPNLPYFSRNALTVLIERTSKRFNPGHCFYLKAKPTLSWEETHI